VAGTRLRLRVVPGAERPGIVGRHGDAWKIRVAAAPERGAANDAVVELLAAVLGIRPREITLVSGHSSRDKIVELTALEPDEAELLLAPANGKDA
jgi:uncharacterized protein (TIGR00251 family)